MNATEPTTSLNSGFPATESDRLEIRSQLERILAHPQFRNSKRYPALLRHVVERSLEGRADFLKERSIGVDIFGREPDYDTNLDHTVRTSAGEVRKRLAQYYVESEHGDEIRIDLPAGSYVPQFRRVGRRENLSAALAANSVVDHGSVIAAPIETYLRKRLREWKVIPAALILAVLVGGAQWARTSWEPASALDQFWAPVSSSLNVITLCISPPTPKDAQLNLADSVAPRTLRDIHGELEKVAFVDAVTLGRLAALTAEKGKKFRVLYSPQISLADLRQGPVILIGGFDNDWTLRMTGPLRFRFERDTDFNITSIRDGQSPNTNEWRIDWRTPYLELTEDYALVSRVSDPTTGETVIVAAGITKYGTLAAGEFLTSARLNDLAKYAPRDWKHKNLQVVLSTKVVKGSPGPPHIMAAHFW